MKISVMGAGAVGCYYGGMLAHAGHDVTLIGREQHVEAIRARGLLLETTTFQEHVALRADTNVAAVSDADVVLVCVKSADSESTATAMAPYLRTDACVLSLQNGVDNAARLQARLQECMPHATTTPVLAAVVYVAAEMAGPGHIKHHGRGELVIAPSIRSEALAETFSNAAIPMEISENVEGALWAKLIVNCAFNALSAITQQPYGPLFGSPGVADVMRDVVSECLACAAAMGVRIPGDSWQAVLRIVESMPTQRSSTAQDMARGKKTEIDHLNGYIAREGLRTNVPTPVNRTLHTLVKMLESKQAA